MEILDFYKDEIDVTCVDKVRQITHCCTHYVHFFVFPSVRVKFFYLDVVLDNRNTSECGYIQLPGRLISTIFEEKLESTWKLPA